MTRVQKLSLKAGVVAATVPVVGAIITSAAHAQSGPFDCAPVGCENAYACGFWSYGLA